jgi:hypothetical protein
VRCNTKIIHNYYSNIPCIGKDCKYWGGEYQEEMLYHQGYDKLGLGVYNAEEFAVICHGEHCNRNEDIVQLRKSIYKRALEASDNIHKSRKYKNIRIECNKASEAFRNIENEWRNMRCPFYEKVN